jgi:hypothetical protein
MIGGECTSCRGVEEKKVMCEVCAGITKPSRTPSLPSQQPLTVRSLSIDDMMAAAAVSFPQADVKIKDDTKDMIAATTTVPLPVVVPTTTETKTVTKTTKKVCHHHRHNNNICCC